MLFHTRRLNEKMIMSGRHGFERRRVVVFLKVDY
jgi:hypothetical protein